MKKFLRYTPSVFILIILITLLIYSPDHRGQLLIVIPDAIFLDKFQLYEKSSESVEYLPSTLNEYLIGPYAENQEERALNFMLDSNYNQYGDLMIALEKRISELGYNDTLGFTYIGLENYGDGGKTGISYWPVTATLVRQENNELISVIELNFAAIKEVASERYKVAAQYSREYDLVRRGIFSVNNSIPLDSFTFERSDSQNSNICFFTEREVSSSLGVTDSINYYFQCLEPYEWAVLSGWKSASSYPENGALPVPECSLGSLWQQFACRYLGQSKYDENGDLKPEAREELGI